MAKGLGSPELIKTVLGILIAASILYAGIMGYQEYSCKNSIGQNQTKLTRYRKVGLASLKRKKAGLEKELSESANHYKEITRYLSSKPKAKMSKEAADPLKFKEELYKVQTKLKEDGSAIGFEFPAGLGFAKYEKEIPTVAELPSRVKQLEIIQEIGILMLKSKVPKITDIEFEDVKDVIAEGSEDTVYKKFPLAISFNCENENLINFLHGLSISDIAFMIDSINLKTSLEKKPAAETDEDKGKLTVEMVISAAIF